MAGILCVVTQSVLCAANPCSASGSNTFYPRLHAIDITRGLEKPGSPVLIAGTSPGNSDASTYGYLQWSTGESPNRQFM